jgi:hypothetical protein
METLNRAITGFVDKNEKDKERERKRQKVWKQWLYAIE